MNKFVGTRIRIRDTLAIFSCNIAVMTFPAVARSAAEPQNNPEYARSQESVNQNDQRGTPLMVVTNANRPPKQRRDSRPPLERTDSRPPLQSTGSRPPLERSDSRPSYQRANSRSPLQRGYSRDYSQEYHQDGPHYGTDHYYMMHHDPAFRDDRFKNRRGSMFDHRDHRYMGGQPMRRNSGSVNKNPNQKR